MRIDPGELDRRIFILRATSVDDGMATVAGTMASVGSRYARKLDVSDRERISAASQGQALTSRFLVRSDPLTRSVTARDVIECRGVRHEIVGTKASDERQDGIEITTTAMTV